MSQFKVVAIALCAFYLIVVVIPASIFVYRRYYYLVHYDAYINQLAIFPDVSADYFERHNIQKPVYNSRKFWDKVTIVTQLTEDRLPRLEFLTQRWKHPISAVIYTFIEDFDKINNDMYLDILYLKHPTLKGKVDFHLVYGRHDATEYRLNYMRNIAWNQSTTDYIFPLDVDFVPSENFDSYPISFDMEMKLHKKSAFIIPAFDYECQDDTNLTSCIVRSETLPDHPSHNATNYRFWQSTDVPYRIKYEMLYEPYMILHKNAPKYDPTFDIGNDKVQHSYELEALKYNLIVLPKIYIAHIPHNKKMMWSLNSKKYNSLRAWIKFAQFMVKMKKTYEFDKFCLMSQDEEDRAKLPPGVRRIRHVCNNLCTNACNK